MVEISAIVCTYNGAWVLPNALNSLIDQSLSADRYEIIIVINGSTDDSQGMVEAFRRQYPEHNIRLIWEPRLGASFARNAGMEQARAQYVAYLDDDAKASANWLEKALSWFQSNSSLICLSGLIAPFYLTPKPNWFLDSYETDCRGQKCRLLERGEAFAGANMIWRRSALLCAGGFDTSQGPRGSEYALHEETALFCRIWETVDQPKFMYDPELKVEHLVPAGKMTITYRWKRLFVAGRDWYRIFGPQHGFAKTRLLCKRPLSIAKQVVLALTQLPKAQTWVQWIIQSGEMVAYELGVFTAALGFRIAVRRASRSTLEASTPARQWSKAHAA